MNGEALRLQVSDHLIDRRTLQEPTSKPLSPLWIVNGGVHGDTVCKGRERWVIYWVIQPSKSEICNMPEHGHSAHNG